MLIPIWFAFKRRQPRHWTHITRTQAPHTTDTPPNKSHHHLHHTYAHTRIHRLSDATKKNYQALPEKATPKKTRNAQAREEVRCLLPVIRAEWYIVALFARARTVQPSPAEEVHSDKKKAKCEGEC